MNAMLKPIPRAIERPAYRGWNLVRQNEQVAWVRLNYDLIAGWFAACGATLDDCTTETMDSFAEAQWDIQRAQYEELRSERDYEYDGASDGSVDWEQS